MSLKLKIEKLKLRECKAFSNIKNQRFFRVEKKPVVFSNIKTLRSKVLELRKSSIFEH